MPRPTCKNCLYFAEEYCHLWNGHADENDVCPAFISRRDVSR